MSGGMRSHLGNSPLNQIGALGNGQHRQTYSQVYGSAAQIASAQAQQRAALNASAQQVLAQQQAALAGTLLGSIGAEEPEDAGVRVGEVIGWRCWLVRDSWLYSVHMSDVEWEPGKDMEAHKISHRFGDGIHAFKTRLQAQEYSRAFEAVIGRVALWGQIYEFEGGWHGEFARVQSLDLITKDLWRRPSWWRRKSPEPALRELRRTYGLTDPERLAA